MNNTSHYIPSLDGLRAVSILLVFFGHVGFGNLIPGGLGVTIFFFISGYIITNLLQYEFDVRGKINLRLFYVRRILRLYPALVLFLLLTTIFVMSIGFVFPFQELVAALFYFENYYFEIAHEYETFHFKILWSLAVEEHFYLAFPIVLVILNKRKKIFLIFVVILITIALLTRVHISAINNSNQAAFLKTYILTHCRFDSILFGCLLSLLVNSDLKSVFLRVSTSMVIFIIGCLFMIASFAFRDDFLRQTFRYSIQGISLLIVISSILFNPRYSWIKGILSNGVLTYIGKLSYSIYLFHFLADKVSLELIKDDNLTRGLLMTLITILLSLFSYHVIEIPFQRLRKRFVA